MSDEDETAALPQAGEQRWQELAGKSGGPADLLVTSTPETGERDVKRAYVDAGASPAWTPPA